MAGRELGSDRPQRRSNAERRAQTRALLIEAAIGSLSELGYARTTTATIAARAGVTTGALHHHFPTKEDLFLAVLDQLSAEISETPGDLLGSPDPARITKAVQRLWSVYGAARYRAVWEVTIGTRTDARLRARVTEQRRAAMRIVTERWCAGLGLGRREKEQAAAVLGFLLISIRGLFLETYLDFDRRYYEQHLAMLSRTVAAQLEQILAKPPHRRAA